jgi:lysophospholipase L1-like esterase
MFVRVLAVFLVFCAALVGSAAAATPTVPAPVDPRLLIIGDSVILGARPWVEALLGARGWRVNQTSWESMHTWQAPAIVDDNKAHGGIGDVVVVQLGTNDGFVAAELQSYMDALMPHLANVERVYWVNLRQFAPWVPAANATIAAEASRFPNMRVIDWDARATPDPSLVYADGYHLNPAGQVAMAELIAQTLDGFVAETAPPATTSTLPATTSTADASTSARVTRHHAGDDVDVDVWLGAGVGALALVGLIAMVGDRAKKKPDSSA